MDQQEIKQWESALDAAELSPLTANLPKEPRVGDVFEDPADGVVRRWVYVKIMAGNVGGRWAYWNAWFDEAKRKGVGVNPRHEVVADKIFNGDAAHFAGMLAQPYVGRVQGVESTAWVLVSPRMAGPTVEYARLPHDPVRYERSKEVYDVESGKTTKLP